jgi:predicted protein tyrosine phosphatase
VLCVCSAGLLRSPTVAWVLSQPPYNCNVRIAGVRPEYALVPVDEVLINWAEDIVAVNKFEAQTVRDIINKYRHALCDPKVWELQLPDQFEFRDPTLVGMIRRQLAAQSFPKYEPNEKM